MKIIPILTLLFMVLVTMVRGAVTVTTITSTDFNSLIGTNQAAWSVMFRGGSTGTGTGVEEIRLARNIATPQANGGSNTLVGNLLWSSTNNTVGITVDGTANIFATANATTVGSWALVNPFNQILIRTFDDSAFGASDLQNIQINGFAVRNMFADGLGSIQANDFISVTNFGSQAPFSLNGVWSPGLGPNANDQYVMIVGLNNTTIPEPSCMILGLLSSVVMLRRRR